jgi:cytochrome c-type biogenesis protein CcmF
LAFIIGWAQRITGVQYVILLFAASFALVSNVYYAFRVQTGSLKKRGAALTHFGFALTLLGVLLSSYGKEVISLNTTGAEINLGKKTMAESIKESRENVILFRGSRVAMGNYYATYLGDSASATDPRTFFKVRFERVDTANEKVNETFTLYPDAFVNPKGQEGLSSNPDTRHYLTRDIFTYVNSIYKATDKGAYRRDTVTVGDTIFLANAMVRFEGFNRDAKRAGYTPAPGDVAVGARLSVHTLEGPATEIQPIFIIRENELSGVDDTAGNAGLFARITNVIPQLNAAVIETKQREPKDEYIVMKALLFPYINVLWLGIVTMVAGFGLSMLNRITKKEPVRIASK